ncbi:hypothetical protein [Methanimicrococcus blatticola]|uniref:hypothetical protein n=1 Tax=Methanimicrococcus blatticola TaxID=91560 RepID=UPI001415125D|nr:hypothetical protein [Methanimicrococcus blatticola]MBZ3935205.1 hypothetical protein [Methanimicrococcus blatticola]MCC2508698.1 hypothetical protein [Methanimicrococcus blatticola]
MLRSSLLCYVCLFSAITDRCRPPPLPPLLPPLAVAREQHGFLKNKKKRVLFSQKYEL